MSATIASARLDARTRFGVLLAAGACVTPLLLQVPTTLALVIAGVAIAMAFLSQRPPLPGWLRMVPALGLGAFVLSTMGVNFGRDTGCAMLAAMLAVKPLETNTLRDARSLLGFALFASFATFLLDQGPLSLALGLLAVVLVLAAMQRLSDVESDDARRPRTSWRRLASVGWMLLLGLPLALAAFWLFPRLASPLWGVPDRAHTRPGLADSMTPGRWGDLLLDDTPAARVRFFGPVPPRDRMYFRGPVFMQYDGRTWSRSPMQSTYTAQPLQVAGASWDYELEFEPTDRRQLIALDVPLSPPANAHFWSDRALRVERPLDSVTRWRMRSAPVATFETDLPRTLRLAALQLPDGFNPRTVALARQWRQDAGTDDAAIVNRALSWIRREFGYTLEVPVTGRDAIDQFLFRDKKGYCEQFSSSFVVLMRAAGIPARVVAGYAGAELNTLGDYWLVRRSDAHAWAEVWLAGRGWVRIDPTAAVAPERVFDTLQDRARASGDLLANLQPMFDTGDWMVSAWNDFVLGFNADRQRRLLQPLGFDAVDPERLLLLFSLVAIAALATTVWLLSRDVRERDPLLRAWHRVGKRYVKLGLGRAPHEPASDWAQRVHRTRAGGDDALLVLGARFNRRRYGSARDAGERLNALLRDLDKHRP
jgi:transglutaminase-like putative cysteine protease